MHLRTLTAAYSQSCTYSHRHTDPRNIVCHLYIIFIPIQILPNVLLHTQTQTQTAAVTASILHVARSASLRHTHTLTLTLTHTHTHTHNTCGTVTAELTHTHTHSGLHQRKTSSLSFVAQYPHYSTVLERSCIFQIYCSHKDRQSVV